MSSKGLGKGLSALISERNTATTTVRDEAALSLPPELDAEQVTTLPLTALRPGKYQPRSSFQDEALDELTESIKANGIVLPLLVRKQGEQYEIIAGERRFRAAKRAGLADVPVIVKELDDQKTLEIALIENVQRQDLDPLEEAEGYQRLIDEFEYTQQALSDAIGKKRTTITNMLRLLNLPGEVKQLLKEKKLTRGHAKVLLSAPNPAELAQQVVQKQLNVRQTEALLNNNARSTQKSAGKSKADLETTGLVKKLSQKIGLDMAIQGSGTAGRLVIRYQSLQELDGILSRLEQGRAD